jgi:DNA-binding transcriptional ArsR family regulator
MEQSPPTDCFQIEDLETLKVFAHPLRHQILESLTLEALTVKQVAERLGLSPGKLYYHINLLEEHGLIQVVEKRILANIIESVYRASAPCLEVDPALLSFGTEEGRQTIHAFLGSGLDAIRDDLLDSLEARAAQLARGAREDPRRVLTTRSLSRISKAQVEAFLARLDQLIEDFEASDAEPEPGADALQPYALSVLFYPRFYHSDSEPDEEPAG